MYNPIQLPYILDIEFKENFVYTETVLVGYTDYIICLWEIRSKNKVETTAFNTIVMDGCVDLVVDFESKNIGFAGMSKTDFEFKIESPCNYFGIRFMPGVFYELTGIDTSEVMDTFVSIESVFSDFDFNKCSTLKYDDMKDCIVSFIKAKLENIETNKFTKLFNAINGNHSLTVTDIYDMFCLGSRQCQRIFKKHYGLSPKQVLCIVRFQRCLKILTSLAQTPDDVLELFYYDQSHFIHDFKTNISLSPFEFVKRYKNDTFLQ